MPGIVSRQNGKSERASTLLPPLAERTPFTEGPISMVRVQGKKRQKHLRNVKQPFPNDGRRGGFFWTANRTVEHFSSLISIATNDQIHDLTLILQTHLQWGKTIAHAYVLLHMRIRMLQQIEPSHIACICYGGVQSSTGWPICFGKEIC